MISESHRVSSQSKPLLKYRFPLWLTIFFLLLILIPILVFSNQLFFAKISGVSCLILVIVALRIWLKISRLNSSKVERVVLNYNQIYELERKYTFLRTLSNSNRQVLFHRTGLLLAELIFISDDELTLREKIDFAFNFSILFCEDEYKSLRGLTIEISKSDSNKDISLVSLDEVHEKKLSFPDYKAKLSESGIFDRIRVKLSDF